MSLVHLAITTLVALAGLSTLQPHVPPAICPYSQEAMSHKHDLLYHAYSLISELEKLCDVDVTYCLVLQEKFTTFRLVPDPSTSDLSVSSMRPDEHKKKQRADYKKKHGISNKKTTSKEKTETAKTVNPTETQGGDGLADTSQGDHKHFSRRKVSSNWDRYEDFEGTSDEEDSSENITKRGEDFNVLLQKSENPSSQFRFQSEKELDQEIEGDSRTTQITASALEIDFGSLAASLNCVPLHKRLFITADGIHPDVVKQFELSANAPLRDQDKTSIISPWGPNEETVTKPATTTITELRPSLENTLQHSLSPHTVRNHEQDINKRTLKQSGNDSKQFTHSVKGDGADLLHVKQPGDVREPCTLDNTQNLQNSLKDVLKTVKTSSKTGTVEPLARASDNEDDELEFLLSLGSPEVKDNSKTSSGNQSNKVTSASVIAPSPSVKPTVQSAKKADDDLEDWLDSVLG